ncbi:NADH pyrophosphatase [Taxawa tesnikishii (nom. ined.)]|nr:NADH pyrophosphatase [Dothideales sp. JES 119]
MLSRKFGKEVANYFSGSPLNRVGFLRGDSTFLSAAVRHPSTSFLLCKDLQPLIKEKTNLAWVKHQDVKPVIGEDPYHQTEDELISQYNSTKYTPQMIFLGLDDREEGLTYKDLYKGAPRFAVDVTPKKSLSDACNELISSLDSRGLTFAQGRAMDLEASDAAIYAEARQLLDWNARNPFCAQCGQPTLSVNGGFKRTCPPTDLANLPAGTTSTTTETPITNTTERPPCATRKGVSNLSFPRTDPTVIMAVVNSAGSHILLGRQKRWPPHWYSTLAGFCEPAESVEEAVRREVWEEAGVKLGRVVVHSTQPWPYPANLMIGAIGQAVPGDGEKIDLGNDPELEDARWFSFDEAREALRVGTSGLGEDAGPEYKEGGLRLPPRTAIAHQLITAVTSGFLGAEPKM